MGVAERVNRPLAALEEVQQVAREIFDSQLRSLGLTAGAIEGKDLDGLEASLNTINDAIANADSFSVIRIKPTADGSWVVAKSDSSANLELSILPILLERKAMILDRIKVLRSEEQLNNLRADVADKVDDEQAREQVLDIIDHRSEQERLAEEKLRREREKTKQDSVDAWERQQRLQIEFSDHRWAVFRSFIERESIAGIIGAILLLAFAAVLVIGMFTHTAAPEVVTSAFLLVLGYFFGQSATKSKDQ
jgi:hypothetical protein